MSRDEADRDIGKVLLPAVRGKMGEREYILCAMPVREAVKRIEFAREIGEFVVSSLSERLQRDFKGNRIRDMVSYLDRDDRFFNSLVVAMCGGDARWRNFSNLRGEGIIQGKYDNKIGFLSLSGEEKIYALDGQHRLWGLREAVNRNNQGVLNDEVGLLIVHHNEYTKVGRRKSRRLFTVLNKYAQKVSKGDIISLDEDDAAAIVVRKLVEDEKYSDFFELEKRIYDSDRNQFPSTQTGCFTTIGVLYDCTICLLGAIGGKTKKNLTDGPRPSEKIVDAMASDIYRSFKEMNENVPAMKEYFRGKGKTYKKIAMNNSERHMLFRPLGLKSLVEIICEYHKTKKFEDITRSVEICTRNLPFEMNKEPLFNIVWDGKKINSKGFRLLKDIYRHILGLLSESRSKDLEKDYQEALEKNNAKLPPKVEVS